MTGIYFDYAATTPMDPQVIATVSEAMALYYGNPSSTYALGRDAKHQIEKTRRQIAQTINADPADIIFTSGGTESNNSALFHTARRLAGKGKHLITAEAEHPSVYKTFKALENEGFTVTYLPYDEQGHISLAEFTAALRDDTIMVSLMHGNNEVGSLQPIQEIGEICAAREIFFHTDTVQTYMKVPIDVEKMHIDALSMSGHKIYGPKGIGFLYYRQMNNNFSAYFQGGGQEHNHRPGTESVPLILGLGKAVELLDGGLEHHQEQWAALRQYFLNRAQSLDLNFHINGPVQAELGLILNIWWPGHASEQMLIKFDLENIYLSAGSACSAGNLTPSRVLVNMYGAKSPRISESFRISFGKNTTRESINDLLDLFVKYN